MKELYTDRLFIRNFKMEDAKEMHELFTDESAMRFLGLYPALTTIKETEERVREWIEDEEHYAIVLKDTGKLVGYIAVNPDSEEEREDTKELGFGLISKYRKNGYMLESVKAVLDQLKKEGIIYVWACCFQGNDASKALIEKAGFQLQNIGTYEVEDGQEYQSYEYRTKL